LNNLWTFADRKLEVSSLPGKFVQFNVASFGSIVIQFIVNSLGEFFIGLHPLFSLGFGGLVISVDTGMVFAVTGILTGMFWNFFAYSHFIWKKKPAKS
jgi:putative flippase GtrA